MKDNKEYIRQRWGNGLWSSLASEGISKPELSKLSDKFDKLTEEANMNPESACGLLLASATQNAKPLLNKIAAWINSELETFNATNPGIDVNPVTRMREAAKREKHNLQKVNIIIDGKEFSDKELDAIRERAEMKLPPCVKQGCTIYESKGSSKPQFSISVII